MFSNHGHNFLGSKYILKSKNGLVNTGPEWYRICNLPNVYFFSISLRIEIVSISFRLDIVSISFRLDIVSISF